MFGMKKHLGKDHRGMTLVELICAVAIFACISAAVSGVLVVTAKTYRGGTTETDLQQEAQLTVNMIESRIVDATDSVNYYYYDAAGAEQYAESEGAALAAGAPADSDRKLQIVNGTQTCEFIYHAATREIRYMELGGAAPATDYLAAENVLAFTADVSQFTSSHNVELTIVMEDESSQYAMKYNITARNGKVDSAPAVPVDWARIIVNPSELVMEPGQVIALFPVDVIGTLTDWSCTVENNSHPGTKVEKVPTGIRITIDKDEVGDTNNELRIFIRTNAYDPSGVNPLASKRILVKIRRIDGLGITMTKDDPTMDSYTAGTTYTARAALTGTAYLNRLMGNAYDNDYKNPFYTQWSWEFTISDAPANAADYFEFTKFEDVAAPYLKVKLKQNMPANSKLKITALAKHPAGNVGGTVYNKSGITYADIQDSVTLECTGGTPVIPGGGAGIPIKRGQDFFFNTIESNTTLDMSIRDNNNKGNGSAQYNWFFRYRVKNDDGSFGTWSEYRMTREGGTEKKLNAEETYCLLPDKAYEIEYISAVTDKNTKKLYWPHDASLLASGTGFDGYTKGWDPTDAPTLEAEYKTSYIVEAVQISFKENTTFGISEGATGIGSPSSPLLMSSSGVTYPNWLEIYLKADSGLEFGHFQNQFNYIIEKWNGTSWESSGASGWSLQKGDKILINNIQSSTSGTYRLKMIMENYVAKQTAGTLMEPQYPNLPSATYHLYDESTGKGIVYVKFN